MNHEHMIEIIQAHKEGKTIECRVIGAYNGDWFLPEYHTSFDFMHNEHRVKEESGYIVIDHKTSIPAAGAGKFVEIKALEDVLNIINCAHIITLNDIEYKRLRKLKELIK